MTPEPSLPSARRRLEPNTTLVGTVDFCGRFSPRIQDTGYRILSFEAQIHVLFF